MEEKRNPSVLSPEDSRNRANPTALQENVRHLVTSVICGMSAPGLQANLSLDGASLKTCRDYLLANADRFSPEFSMTWPRWGIAQDGEFGALSMSARHTEGTESSLWHTPTAHNAKEGAYPAEFRRKTPTLEAEAKMGMPAKLWPTPQASDNRDRGNLSSGAVQRRMEKGKQISLSQCVDDQSGALNPEWVEWLMGFPIGHTDLER